MHSTDLTLASLPAPRTLEEFSAWRASRDEELSRRCRNYSLWAAEHGKSRPPEDSPEMTAWRATAQAAHDNQVYLSAMWNTRETDAIWAYWSKEELRHYLRTTRFFSCPEQERARTWPWNSGEPTAAAVARIVLEPLSTQDYRVAFDPDSRTWLRFNPDDGYFSKISGTAEQAARVLVTEVSEATRIACEKISAYEQRRWNLPEDERLAVNTGAHWGYCRFRKIISGEWYAEDGYGPSVSQVAQAMVDLASCGDMAEQARKGLTAGESGRGMFLPWKRERLTAGSAPFWSSGGYEGVYNFGGDPVLDEMNYSEIPFKAARYLPDPEVTYTGFSGLLDLVFPGGQEQQEAWLRSTAMAFTGIPTKEVLFWRGETNRGKSLLASLMSDLLGGYARNIPAKLLFGYATDDQRAAQELVGTWMAVVEEGMGNQSFKANEAFKAMSNGGALLNARQLYHESRTVAATHTLVLCANAEADPDFKDDAILARLVPIAFTGHPDKIVEYAGEYNPSSRKWKEEAPGILARMLSYASDFTDGTWRPKTLLDLKKAGFLGAAVDDDLMLAIEMNTATNVAQWVASEYQFLSVEEVAPDGITKKQKEWAAHDLYSRYSRWCSMQGIHGGGDATLLTQTKWGRELKQVRGVEFRRSNGARYAFARR